ncbi:hypothetical protein QFZ58_000033 [Streptomyces sp. B1I3]|nr:hypothetical protein [Streptomyces sp. B1I3]
MWALVGYCAGNVFALADSLTTREAAKGHRPQVVLFTPDAHPQFRSRIDDRESSRTRNAPVYWPK